MKAAELYNMAGTITHCHDMSISNYVAIAVCQLFLINAYVILCYVISD